MNKKAFLLVDSLVCLIVVTSLAFLCFATFNQISKHEEVNEYYYEETTSKYETIFKSMSECIKCEIEENLEEEDF